MAVSSSEQSTRGRKLHLSNFFMAGALLTSARGQTVLAPVEIDQSATTAITISLELHAPDVNVHYHSPTELASRHEIYWPLVLDGAHLLTRPSCPRTMAFEDRPILQNRQLTKALESASLLN
jgi:hypothetical protein